MKNNWIIFYLSEQDRVVAEILKSMIQSKKEIRCEVRNVSYLGILANYDKIILCSLERSKNPIKDRILMNYNGKDRWYQKCSYLEFFERSTYNNFYPSRTTQDYYEFLCQKTIDNFFV